MRERFPVAPPESDGDISNAYYVREQEAHVGSLGILMRIPNGNALAPTLIAIASGMVLWFTAAQFIEAREPWDDSAYWTIVYPLALLVSALLAYFYPDRPWRWALSLFLAQLIAMWIQSGEVGNLWPLSLVAIGILALPAIWLANFIARFARTWRA